MSGLYFAAFTDTARADSDASLTMAEAVMGKLRKPWIGIMEEGVGMYIPPGAVFISSYMEGGYLGVYLDETIMFVERGRPLPPPDR